jgi:hypothetical protein
MNSGSMCRRVDNHGIAYSMLLLMRLLNCFYVLTNIILYALLISNAVFFLVLETGVWCYFPENKSITSTSAVVTEVKDSFCGKILSLLPFNIGTTNFCPRDESSLQQATD